MVRRRGAEDVGPPVQSAQADAASPGQFIFPPARKTMHFPVFGVNYSVKIYFPFQEETKSLLAEMSGLDRLREDRERLQEENRELRKFFGTNP